MKKTVCELFAGVGGFRCGLNSIKTIEDASKPEKWNTVWFSQWEPSTTKQWAHDCYVNRFGTSLDLNGKDTTNLDIAEVPKNTIPDHNLLVGGFPCQDYSVARGLSGEKGIEGKKGVLWWSIRDVIKAKNPPFILLENVDRLLKSPSKQRGRDFGIILACLRDEGYIVEWRVINAAEYGYVQRRRRTFIFAYRKETNFASQVIGMSNYNVELEKDTMATSKIISSDGFFARTFPVIKINEDEMEKVILLDKDIVKVSDDFQFLFENSGIMIDSKVYTIKTTPLKVENKIVLGDVLEDKPVPEEFFVKPERLYYTDSEITHSNEAEDGKLSKESRQTWQYLKGAKKIIRTSKSGHDYVFSEGPIKMVDEWDAPARTMLTSEGSFNRSTHIVRDKGTNEIRILTPIEAERIQGFPDDWTKESLIDGEKVEMPRSKRYFCMGNALVVDLIRQMESEISKIFDNE